ncbi:MAG TPA: SPFH domain-containing protein [Polyangiaceae bacterium]|nr:SPFH domain-containing protein [Polyangiaceae bacterium]
MSSSQKNTYLEEVVHQKEQIERELKAQRVPAQAAMVMRHRRAPLGGAAAALAEDTGAFRALAAPAPGAAAAASAVDVRITGFWRWKNVIVPPNALVVHTRRGHAEPLHCGLGISFRFDPVTDAFLAVPAAMQTIMLQAKCVCRERQGVMVQGYVQWIIEDFRVAYQKLDFTDALDPMRVVNVQLREQAEAAIKDTVSMMSIDQVLGDKQPIIRELTARLRQVAEGERDGSYEGLGLKIVTVQIKEAVVSSQQVWEALQRPFRAERSRDARLAELASEAAVRARETEEDKARARTRIETEAEISRLRAASEAEAFDREVAERVRRAEREAESLAAVQAHEAAKIEAEAAVARLRLRHELEAQRERDEAEHRQAERAVALEAARRRVENDLSRAALEARLIAALPEVAEKMPRPNELRAISVGAPEGLAGLVQGVFGLLERGRGSAAGGGGASGGAGLARRRGPSAAARAERGGAVRARRRGRRRGPSAARRGGAVFKGAHAT